MPPSASVPYWKHVSHGVVMAILCSGRRWSSAFIALVRVSVKARGPYPSVPTDTVGPTGIGAALLGLAREGARESKRL
eukprot:scaffold76_cov54-Phaeocystis_antarctica.AAC.2